jgi:hypothetical protein
MPPFFYVLMEVLMAQPKIFKVEGTKERRDVIINSEKDGSMIRSSSWED